MGKKIYGVLQQGWLFSDKLGIAAELDGTGQVVSRFIYGTRSNVPDLMIKSGITYRIMSDQRGSPVLTIDTSSGETIQYRTYDEFGNITADTNPNLHPIGFAGGLYDSDTGLSRRYCDACPRALRTAIVDREGPQSDSAPQRAAGVENLSIERRKARQRRRTTDGSWRSPDS